MGVTFEIVQTSRDLVQKANSFVSLFVSGFRILAGQGEFGGGGGVSHGVTVKAREGGGQTHRLGELHGVSQGPPGFTRECKIHH